MPKENIVHYILRTKLFFKIIVYDPLYKCYGFFFIIINVGLLNKIQLNMLKEKHYKLKLLTYITVYSFSYIQRIFL